MSSRPVLTVGSNMTYASIKDAMEEAGPYYEIQLAPGYSGETATVTFNDMTFTGEASSTDIVLQLASGVTTVRFTGEASIDVQDTIGDNTIFGNDGDNVVTVTGGSDAVSGGLGRDRLIVDYQLATGAVTGTLSNVAEAGGGARLVTHGGFEDYTILTGSGADTITTGAGDDEIRTGEGASTVDAGEGRNIIVGGSGADTITAGNGGNSIGGGDGANTITTGSGADVIWTGIDADTVVTGGGNDQITVKGGADSVDAGNEADRLIVDYAAALTAVTGGVTTGDLAAGYSGHIADLGTARVDFVGVEGFEITTGTGDDTIKTAAGHDVVRTGAGDDKVDTGAGADVLDGGAGNDVLSGELGDDRIDGGTGDDFTIGGLGHDAYFVDSVGDTVVENPGEGIDKVFTGLLSYTLGANLENLAGTSGAGQTLIGNGIANVITGNFGDDILTGGDGNDRLDGRGGKDDMAGGAGDDFYYVDHADDRVTEEAGAGTNDCAISSVAYTLSENVENLILTGTADINGTGNELDNALTGNAGNNVLDGSGGTDVMNGGSGDDTYIVDTAGETVIESVNGGNDTVESSASFHLANTYEIEKLTLTGSLAINATGNDLTNTLTGNGAANRLSGGGGNDTMIGGGGDDLYIVDGSAETIVELGREGLDTVQSSASYTLSDNIERLFLTNGAGNIDATGNALVNTMVGNADQNVLDGAGGRDVMNGGKGDDTYIVDTSGESVIEVSGGGYDTVKSSATFYLSETYELEALTLTGSADIKGYGNKYDNTLIGNSGANGLGGNAGDDSLYGGDGHDRMAGGEGADSFYFDTALGAGNVDKLLDFTVADDTIVLEQSVFTGMQTGTLSSGAFVAGTQAGDSDDRIIYDVATGNIWFDADGNGTDAPAVLFATVMSGATLTHLDFEIYASVL